jgi:hypothetical protein
MKPSRNRLGGKEMIMSNNAGVIRAVITTHIDAVDGTLPVNYKKGDALAENTVCTHIRSAHFVITTCVPMVT